MHFWLWLSLILVFGYFLGAWGSSVIFAVYLLYQIHYAAFRTKSWVNPIIFYQISVLLATLSNVRILYMHDTGIYLRSYMYAVPQLFDEAALVWAIGNIFLIKGYHTVTRAKLPALKWNLPGMRSMNIVFWLSLILVFRSLWLPFSLPGTLDSLLTLFPLLGILLYARLASLNNSKRLFILATILTVLSTGHAVLFAYLRINMVIPIIVFMIGTLTGSKNLKVLFSPRFYPIYGFIFVFSIFFVTFGATRSTISVGWDRVTDLLEAKHVEQQIDRVSQLSAFERSSTIGQLSAVSGLVSDYGHFNGTVSQPLLVAFIPRFLWPDKPPIALGVWFALEIGEATPTTAGWYNTSINMTIPGHLFLDFGWIGLVIGCWLVGSFLKLLWSASNFSLQLLNIPGAFFAMYLLYNSLLGLGADLQILITMLAIYLILLAFDRFLILIRPSKQKSVISHSQNNLPNMAQG